MPPSPRGDTIRRELTGLRYAVQCPEVGELRQVQRSAPGPLQPRSAWRPQQAAFCGYRLPTRGRSRAQRTSRRGFGCVRETGTGQLQTAPERRLSEPSCPSGVPSGLPDRASFARVWLCFTASDYGAKRRISGDTFNGFLNKTWRKAFALKAKKEASAANLATEARDFKLLEEVFKNQPRWRCLFPPLDQPQQRRRPSPASQRRFHQTR